MASSIVQDKKVCFLCGNAFKYGWNHLEEHHCFGGPNRRWSEEYGLKVWLCGSSCHRSGKHSVHKDRDTDLMVKRAAQKKFEETHSREEFMRIFGKNYIWDEEEDDGQDSETADV